MKRAISASLFFLLITCLSAPAFATMILVTNDTPYQFETVVLSHGEPHTYHYHAHFLNLDPHNEGKDYYELQLTKKDNGRTYTLTGKTTHTVTVIKKKELKVDMKSNTTPVITVYSGIVYSAEITSCTRINESDHLICTVVWDLE